MIARRKPAIAMMILSAVPGVIVTALALLALGRDQRIDFALPVAHSSQ